MWKGIINKAFTEANFNEYVNKVVRPAITKHGWRPRGVIIHMTDRPRLSQWPGVVKGKPITAEQRLRNIEAGYIRDMGWRSGPHWFVSPTNIHAFTPAWTSGTHSPSFNASYWGLELVGNFDVEEFPESERRLAVHAIACLFAALGMTPTVMRKVQGETTFHGSIGFHKDDPRTTHTGCPSKNIGTKEEWAKDVEAEMARLHAGDHKEVGITRTEAPDNAGGRKPPVHKPGKGLA
jgi:hypothetical protein